MDSLTWLFRLMNESNSSINNSCDSDFILFASEIESCLLSSLLSVVCVPTSKTSSVAWAYICILSFSLVSIVFLCLWRVYEIVCEGNDLIMAYYELNYLNILCVIRILSYRINLTYWTLMYRFFSRFYWFLLGPIIFLSNLLCRFNTFWRTELGISCLFN